MARRLILVPLSIDTELSVIALGLVKAMREQGISSCYFCPVKQEHNVAAGVNSLFIDTEQAMQLLQDGSTEELLEEIVALYSKLEASAEVVIIEGLHYLPHKPYITKINRDIALALDADIVLVASSYEKKWPENLPVDLAITKQVFEADGYEKVVATILHGIKFAEPMLKNLELATYVSTPKPAIKSVRNKVNHVAENFDSKWLRKLYKLPHKDHYSAARFRHNLLEEARILHKSIALPDSTDPRMLKAALTCARRNIAECVLIGDPKTITATAKEAGIKLNSGIEVVDSKTVRRQYVDALVELRKDKGMNKKLAQEALKDDYILSLMMLKQHKVDGVVAGAIYTSAHVIRHALRIIKPAPKVKLVSSGFFMCVAQQMLFYADCALNREPSAEELADIAMMSAKTAAEFGIEPKVAMISYSTYESGKGVSVEKVRAATNLVKKRCPKLIIDGPVQYDAARVPEVAHKKAPKGVLEGEATVCVFPNLDVGNSIYKAVQRAANIISIGPMLQGLSQPVNDLSRGCLVDDIVFSIALTAVQADIT